MRSRLNRGALQEASVETVALSVTTAAVERARSRIPEEVPIAITVNGSTYAVLMATPSGLEDFGVGFALTEGMIEHPAEIVDLQVLAVGNGIEVRLWLLQERANALAARRRASLGPVGCGLCGIESLAQALRELPFVSSDEKPLTVAEVMAAGDLLKAEQNLHQLTGLSHAAGFLQRGNGLLASAEDVGRHNALDKLLGHLARVGIPARSGAIVLTSRISLELVQKAAMAQCPVLISVSGPTALAVQQAQAAGITLAGYAHEGSFEIYCHSSRIEGLNVAAPLS